MKCRPRCAATLLKNLAAPCAHQGASPANGHFTRTCHRGRHVTADTATVKSLTAYNKIRELILSGDMLPGSRLVLAELEARLQVGRGPVREAIMRLDKSGLVQNIPFKGAVVMPPPSFREMEVMYQLRVQVERIMAAEAMRRASQDDIDALEGLAATMLESRDDESLFFHQDRQFHSQLYALACMPHLQSIIDRMLDHVEVFLNTHAYAAQDKELFLEQHRLMLQALRDKDERLLCDTLEENILVGLALVQGEMERFKNRRSACM